MRCSNSATVSVILVDVHPGRVVTAQTHVLSLYPYRISPLVRMRPLQASCQDLSSPISIHLITFESPCPLTRDKLCGSVRCLFMVEMGVDMKHRVGGGHDDPICATRRLNLLAVCVALLMSLDVTRHKSTRTDLMLLGGEGCELAGRKLSKGNECDHVAFQSRFRMIRRWSAPRMRCHRMTLVGGCRPSDGERSRAFGDKI
jgi:hypothetical protein